MSSDATKVDVKNAVERLFDVKVGVVRVLNVKVKVNPFAIVVALVLDGVKLMFA